MIFVLGWFGCGIDYRLDDEDSTVVPPVAVTETFEQTPLSGVDVLFVVDGTGSMAEEQAALAGAASRFIDTLTGLSVAWQVGVISTDPADGGVLLGDPWILTRSFGGAASTLATTVSLGADRLPPSAGIAAAVSALADTAGLNTGFRREDAALHVVFVSDDDDASDDLLGADPVAALRGVLDAEATRTGNSARVSAIIGDVPAGCEGEGGAARPGTRYAELAVATGGVVGSICAADFGDIAASLGAGGVDWNTRFELQATPNPGSVVVHVDGERQTSGWSLVGGTIEFIDPPAPGALIVVDYQLVVGP